MTLHRLIRTAIVVCLIFVSGEHPGTLAADRDKIEQWKQFLRWLPEDTETIVVAQGTFPIEPAGDKFENRNAWHLPAGPLFSLNDAFFSKSLNGRKVVCAVEGSRRFTAPKRFGMMLYEGAHFVQFEDVDRELIRKAFQDCRASAQKRIELAGHRVAVFTEKRQGQEDEWTYFVAQPRPGLLICATDQGYLEESLKRMTQEPKTRALPEDLLEWKQVDVKAPVWGLRHYSKKFADQDYSSPVGGKSAPEVADKDAVGLVFWIDQANKTARVRYLSRSRDALKIATNVWHAPSEGLTPQIRQAEPGSIEIVAQLSEEKATNMFVFVLLWQLGHTVIL
jgi:hypothetical protein